MLANLMRNLAEEKDNIEMWSPHKQEVEFYCITWNVGLCSTCFDNEKEHTLEGHVIRSPSMYFRELHEKISSRLEYVQTTERYLEDIKSEWKNNDKAMIVKRVLHDGIYDILKRKIANYKKAVATDFSKIEEGVNGLVEKKEKWLVMMDAAGTWKNKHGLMHLTRLEKETDKVNQEWHELNWEVASVQHLHSLNPKTFKFKEPIGQDKRMEKLFEEHMEKVTWKAEIQRSKNTLLSKIVFTFTVDKDDHNVYVISFKPQSDDFDEQTISLNNARTTRKVMIHYKMCSSIALRVRGIVMNSRGKKMWNRWVKDFTGSDCGSFGLDKSSIFMYLYREYSLNYNDDDDSCSNDSDQTLIRWIASE